MTASVTEPASPPPDVARFREVIGHFVSGVTVITTFADGRPYATTASAVCSLSLEPPMLLACLHNASVTGAAIRSCNRFAVNVLADDQVELARALATKRPDKFGAIERWAPSEHGLPLIGGSLAQIECRLRDVARGGTHTVFLGEVMAAHAAAGAPLTYYRGHLGRIDGELLRQAHGLDPEPPIERAADVDAATARQAIEARCLIETAVADQLVGVIAPRDVDELRARARTVREMIAGGDRTVAEIARAGQEFHDTFVATLGNPFLSAAHRRLGVPAIWMRVAPTADAARAVDASYLEALVDAVARGDRTGLRTILHTHAAQVAALVEARLARARSQP